jgi:hypothetical protein
LIEQSHSPILNATTRQQHKPLAGRFSFLGRAPSFRGNRVSAAFPMRGLMKERERSGAEDGGPARGLEQPLGSANLGFPIGSDSISRWERGKSDATGAFRREFHIWR